MVFKRKIEIHQDEAFEGLESARAYAREAEKSTRRYMAFLERLEKLDVRGRVLDVGAGPGILTTTVAQKYPDVELTALEVSANMVTVGQDYLQSKGLENRINYVIGDATDTTLLQSLGKFDFIFSTYTLHHWDNPRQVIDNLTGILSDNGVLFLHDLRRVWWLYWIPSQSGFIKSVRGSYIRKEIEELLTGLNPDCYEITNDIPFMQSVIIRKAATA